MKLKIHYLKHQTIRIGQQQQQNDSHDTGDDSAEPNSTNFVQRDGVAVTTEKGDIVPEDLSSKSPSTKPDGQPTNLEKSPIRQPEPASPSNFVDSLSFQQNLHLAHLAFYQHNPFYYQNFYPFLSSTSAIPLGASVSADHQNRSDPSRVDSLAKNLNSNQTSSPTSIPSQSSFPTSAGAAAAGAASASLTNFPSNQFELALAASAASAVDLGSLKTSRLLHTKRKLNELASGVTVYDQLLGGLPKKICRQTSVAAGTAAAAAGSIAAVSTKPGNFKMFKDEPIPHGYLKFRFNEDCNFPNCGYRNHQSHFHCCRNDCFYSFCDKTRFVQHTARHERLDKLMGEDFKQYRANMRCGYDECAYNKNMGKFPIYFCFVFFFVFWLKYLP